MEGLNLLWTLRQNLVHLVHIIILILRVVISFHLHIRNANEVIWQFWDGENSLFVTQGTSQFLCVSQFFPIHGLAVVMKKNSPLAASPLVGEFFFPTRAKSFVGKMECAIRDSWGILFSHIRGFATHMGKSHPYFSPDRDWLNSSKLFWRNWYFINSIPPNKFGGIDQFLQTFMSLYFDRKNWNQKYGRIIWKDWINYVQPFQRFKKSMNITKFSTSCTYHHSYFDNSYKFSLTY